MKFRLAFPVFVSFCLALSACHARHGSCGQTLRQTPAPALAQGVSAPANTPLPRKAKPVFLQGNGILLVYPGDSAVIEPASTFLVGSSTGASQLNCNGQPVKLNKQGFFAHVVRLAPGLNQFTLERDGSKDLTLKLTVKRPLPPAPAPERPLTILKDSLAPSEDMSLTQGDTVEFAVRASPGCRLSVTIGKRTVRLLPPGKKKNTAVNLGLDTAYGVAYQRSPASYADLYTGFYRVQSDDHWCRIAPRFHLSRDGKSVQATGAGRLSVLAQPCLAATVHADTVVRLGPGKARTTPLPEGVRLLIDGSRGDFCRAELAPGHHVWIEKKDLALDDGPGLPPASTVRTINLEPEGKNGARVVIPLNQRLPYQIEQQIKPNKLVLRIFGATSDTDWITPGTSPEPAGEPAAACLPGKETVPVTKTFPDPADRGNSPICFVTWSQPSDRLYQATINLNLRQQWGFWADYEGNNLVLHIKGAPDIVPGGAPLTGLIVAVDPGHGGDETGSIGCSGTFESAVNLAICRLLKQMLEEDGATVIMTRVGNDMDVSLPTRVATAIAARADLLVSVHNNALPDGRNPLSEHGTSSYWYHGQAIALSQKIKEAVMSELNFADIGTRYQNLALCRPSHMLSVLVEVGFMINPDEYAQLIDPAGQSRAARGIEKGIKNFLLQAIKPNHSDKNGSTGK